MTGLALFGGSFNPPHLAHENIVRACLVRLPIERLVVLPSGTHPFKRDDPQMAAPATRLALCKLAFAFDPRIEVSDHEQRRTGPSFTVDTLRAFASASPPATELWLVIGSDNLTQLPLWREHHEILRLARLAIYPRAGFPIDLPALGGLDLSDAEKRLLLAGALPIPPERFSSTEVRARLARGADVTSMLHPAVLARIRELHLYGT